MHFASFSRFLSPLRRRRRALAIIVALSYLCTFWLIGCADTLLLRPSRNPIALPFGTTRRLISVGADQVELASRSSPACATRPVLATVLLFPPNSGRAETELLFRSCGWDPFPVELIALNYPGYGNSPGNASLASVAGASLATYDALAAEHPGRPIFLQGYSMGTTAALHVASRRPVAGLYLYAVPPLHQVLMEDKGWWNLWLLAYPLSRGIPPELEALQSAPTVTARAVYIIGARDTYVPTRFQRRVAAAHAGPAMIVDLPLTHDDIPETGHLAEVERALHWLWDTAQASRK